MSNIDPTKPTYGQALTSDVRANFQYAYTEITDLQNAIGSLITITTGGPFLSLAGGSMNGPLNLYGDPQQPLEAVPLRYLSNALNTTIANYIPTSQKAQANGVASLDATGIVPQSQLPGSIIGSVTYRGGWNAATNTPVMASGALVGGVLQPAGYYYIVTVSGTTAAIDTVTTWVAGDWIVSNGTIWQKISNSTSPYIPLTGGTATGQINAPALSVQSDVWGGIAYAVDFAYTIRDIYGSIALAIGLDGTVYLAAVPTPTSALMPISKGYADANYLTNLGGNMSGPFGVQSNSVFSQPLEADLAFSIRDGNGNIAFAVDTAGRTVAAMLTGNGNLPAMAVTAFTYTDLISAGASLTDWLSAYSYDLTITDGTNIVGGVLKDGRLRITTALPTQELTITVAGLAGAYQLDSCIANIISCVATGGVQLKRQVGSAWYVMNSSINPMNVWPPSGGKFGSLAPNSFITLESGAAIILWQASANIYGVMQAGSGGGGAGYVFTGTGFTNPRDMHDRVADTVNVNDLVAGIDTTGVVDNSTQIKAAHDLAFAMGYRYMWFPARSKINAPFGGATAAPMIYNVIFIGENCTINTYRKVIADPHGKSWIPSSDDLTPIMMDALTTIIKAATNAAPAKILILGHSGVDANQRDGQGGGLTTLLKAKLEKVYGNRPIRIIDRSIGGTAWIDLAWNKAPGNAYGSTANNPVWWAQWYETNHPGLGYTRRWIEYALDEQPIHAIFFCHGANDNQNIDVWNIQAFLQEVAARFSPVPMIFSIADYGRKMHDTFTGTYPMAQQFEYATGFLRTFWRRNGVGFFDFGRAVQVYRDGSDPVGGTLKNFIDGFALSDGGNNNQITAQPMPWSFPSNQSTTNFSFRLGANGNMNAFFGSKKLIVQLSQEAENILILEQDVSGKLAYTVQTIFASNSIKYGRDPTWPPPTVPYYSVPRTISTFDLTLTGGLTIELDVRDGMMDLQLSSKSGVNFTQPYVSHKHLIDRYGGYFLPNVRWDTGATTPASNILQAASYVPDQYIPQMTDEEFLPAATLHINVWSYTKMWWPVINAARFV